MRANTYLRASRIVAAASLVSGAILATTGAAVAQDPAADVVVEILTEDTSDPTNIAVADDGRVIFTDRTGEVRVWRQDGTLTLAGRLDVSANASDGAEAAPLEEGGLHGLLLARDFDTSGLLYLYYSVPESVDPDTREGIFRLATFVLGDDDVLDLSTETTILEVPAEWDECCHYGGDMVWLSDGTIVMSTGDDTNPHSSSGYAPTDDRDGRDAFNALRSARNPLDLRGKLLRFNPDGSVPVDNPHVGDAAYDPLVYALGFRSPWKIGVDPATDTVYVGNVGPDAVFANPTRGPAGHDEFEVVPKGGGTDHGWPHCIADNTPYYEYDWAASQGSGLPFVPEVGGVPGPAYDCTGMTPAAIYYTANDNFGWTALGTGSRTAIASDVYPVAPTGALSLPEAWHGRALFFEYSRDSLMVVHVNADGAIDPDTLTGTGLTFRGPAEGAVGPDGAVYVAEYGGSFYANADSRISRITCAGCTPDPADYAGAPAVATPAPAPAPAPDPDPAPATDPLPTTGGGLALAGVLALLGARRRRTLA